MDLLKVHLGCIADVSKQFSTLVLCLVVSNIFSFCYRLGHKSLFGLVNQRFLFHVTLAEHQIVFSLSNLSVIGNALSKNPRRGEVVARVNILAFDG